jgi:type VI secretion system secreted protein Hcp
MLEGYLRIPDIAGESTREGHLDSIEVFGIAFDMEAPFDTNALSRRGRVRLGMFGIRKHYDRSSPYLKRACMQNRHIRDCRLTLRRSVGGDVEDYLVVTLDDVNVVSYALKPSTERPGLIEEEIAFAYRRIGFDYVGGHVVELDLQR